MSENYNKYYQNSPNMHVRVARAQLCNVGDDEWKTKQFSVFNVMNHSFFLSRNRYALLQKVLLFRDAVESVEKKDSNSETIMIGTKTG